MEHLFKYEELVQYFQNTYGHIPAITKYCYLLPDTPTFKAACMRDLPRVLCEAYEDEQLMLAKEYAETQQHYIFIIGSNQLFIYAKKNGAVPTGKLNTSSIRKRIAQVSTFLSGEALDLNKLDHLIVTLDREVVSLSTIVHGYCKDVGYLIYGNGERGIFYKDNTLYNVKTSLKLFDSLALKKLLNWKHSENLVSVLDEALDAGTETLVLSVLQNMVSAKMNEDAKQTYNPPMVLMLDKRINIFPDGFFVCVNLASKPFNEQLEWLRGQGSRQLFKYIEQEFYESFNKRIGSLNFYKPVGITLLRCSQVQVEYQVKAHINLED